MPEQPPERLLTGFNQSIYCYSIFFAVCTNPNVRVKNDFVHPKWITADLQVLTQAVPYHFCDNGTAVLFIHP